MEKGQYILDGYQFVNQAEYDRAKKEKETIAYLMANTDTADMKALLKIYNRSVEKKSFQTIIGQQFLYDLRKRLIGSQIVSEDTLAPVQILSEEKGGLQKADKDAAAQISRYKSAYENAVANRKIKNILIGVLIAVIIGMIGITAASRYSVFTYFTDYETKMRNEIIDEMESWQKQLDDREEELNQREAALKGQDRKTDKE